MKKKSIALTILLTTMLITSCGTSNGNPSQESKLPEGTEQTTDIGKDTEEDQMSQAKVKKLTAEQAYERIESGDEIVLVDVRRQDEYDQGHIEGSILISNESIGTKQPTELPDLDAEILVYCRSGNRSAQAAEKLVEMGYTNVSDFGGIIDWPYETVTGE